MLFCYVCFVMNSGLIQIPRFASEAIHVMRVGRALTACELASLFGLRHRMTPDAVVNFEGLTENKAKASWLSWFFNCQTDRQHARLMLKDWIKLIITVPHFPATKAVSCYQIRR